MRPFVVLTGSPDPARETLRIMVARLHAAPSAIELSGAAVLERWRLFPGEPYMLQGHAGSSLKSGVAFALDIDAGWARLIDRWVRLGAPAAAPPRVTNDAVMQAAARALERDERPPPQPSPTRGGGSTPALWRGSAPALRRGNAPTLRRDRRASTRARGSSARGRPRRGGGSARHGRA
jgi:hypothetical protein